MTDLEPWSSPPLTPTRLSSLTLQHPCSLLAPTLSPATIPFSPHPKMAEPLFTCPYPLSNILHEAFSLLQPTLRCLAPQHLFIPCPHALTTGHCCFGVGPQPMSAS